MLQAFWMYITLMALWSAWVLSVAFLATSGSIVVDQATGYVKTDRKLMKKFNLITSVDFKIFILSNIILRPRKRIFDFF